ncbi:MAG: hypothetical protein PCFJNLEI_00138 [Verrucomicrobiae bacterium]|nr:hypothetical protein [Verrucomicrobiae bacterium]
MKPSVMARPPVGRPTPALRRGRPAAELLAILHRIEPRMTNHVRLKRVYQEYRQSDNPARCRRHGASATLNREPRPILPTAESRPLIALPVPPPVLSPESAALVLAIQSPELTPITLPPITAGRTGESQTGFGIPPNGWRSPHGHRGSPRNDFGSSQDHRGSPHNGAGKARRSFEKAATDFGNSHNSRGEPRGDFGSHQTARRVSQRGFGDCQRRGGDALHHVQRTLHCQLLAVEDVRVDCHENDIAAFACPLLI